MRNTQRVFQEHYRELIFLPPFPSPHNRYQDEGGGGALTCEEVGSLACPDSGERFWQL